MVDEKKEPIVTPAVEKKEAEAEEDEWVTPENINGGIKFGKETIGQKQLKVELEAAPKMSVGILTSDFAMQNVILQIGIPLFSFEGMRVATVRQFVLRCRACREYGFRLSSGN